MQFQPRSFTTTYSRKVNVLTNEVSISNKPYRPTNIPEDVVFKEYLGIWDTGATNTVITQKVARECQLEPTGMVKVYTVGGEKLANTYLVNIRLLNKVEVCELRVTEGEIQGAADVLIGMDVIGNGDFAVTNKDNKTVFSFRMPSTQCIDFVKYLYKEQAMKSSSSQIGRNDPCPCGSGKKYKHCCGKK